MTDLAKSITIIILLIIISTANLVVAATNKQIDHQPSIGQNNVTTGWQIQQSSRPRWHHRQKRMTHHSDISQKENKIQLAEVTLSNSLRYTYTRGENSRAFTINTQSYSPDRKYIGDPSFVDSNSAEHKLRCQKDLKFYEKVLDSVLEFDPENDKNSYEHLMLADSFGRPEAGALRGGQFWLGSYLQCLDINLKRADDDDSVKSQYCLGLTQFPKWNRTEYWTAIKVGLCLPETCTTSMINENSQLLATVEKMMKGQFVTVGPYSKLRLNEVYCLPHETSPIRQFPTSGYCCLLLIGAFVVASLVATVLDYCQTSYFNQSERTKRNCYRILIDSFSLIKNINKFLHIREIKQVNGGQQKNEEQEEEGLNLKLANSNPDDSNWSYDRSLFLNTISGLKCLGLFWIAFGHVVLFCTMRTSNPLDFDRYKKTLLVTIYSMGHLFVNTFYTISGIITAFFLFKTGLDRMKFKQWIFLIIHRYWRLTPIYLLCFWFAKSVGSVINSGPMWDFVTSEKSYRLNCVEESWLIPLLHSSDYKSVREHCVPMAFYIANEMKFFIIAPIFLIILNKSIRQGYLAIISTILASSIYVAITTINTKLDINIILDLRAELFNVGVTELEEVYIRPYSCISCYLIGLLTGHLLYLVDGKKFQLKLSKNSITISRLLTPIILLIFVFAAHLVSQFNGVDENVVMRLIGISFASLRPSWAIFNCWLVVALAHGQARWLSRFLGSKFFRILSKLCFCSYLVQSELICQIFMGFLQANSFSYVDLITKPISFLMLQILLGFFVMLLFEYPLSGIEDLIIPKKQSNPTPSNKTQTNVSGNDRIDIDSQYKNKNRIGKHDKNQESSL